MFLVSLFIAFLLVHASDIPVGGGAPADFSLAITAPYCLQSDRYSDVPGRAESSRMEQWLAVVADNGRQAQMQPFAGGPCEYKKYRGTATIVAIEEVEPPNISPRLTYRTYEVKFQFHPGEPIQESFARVEGREYPLQLQGAIPPGPKFLEKYGIAVGQEFECYLKVITRGTCTPILFEFPTIDLADRFENQE